MFTWNAWFTIGPSGKTFPVETPHGLPVTLERSTDGLAQKLLERWAMMLIDIDRRGLGLVPSSAQARAYSKVWRARPGRVTQIVSRRGPGEAR